MLTVAFAFFFGCGYQSAYVAPLDGRARAVWKDSDVVVELAAAPVSPACLGQLAAWSPSGKLRLWSGDFDPSRIRPPRLTVTPGLGFWVPIYFGAPLVSPGPGLLPLAPSLVLFSPSLTLAAAVSGHVGVDGAGASLGSGGGKGQEVLAAVLLVVLPVIDVLLATIPPESERSSDAIDQVNVFNDLARTPGTPCSYGLGLGGER